MVRLGKIETIIWAVLLFVAGCPKCNKRLADKIYCDELVKLGGGE